MRAQKTKTFSNQKGEKNKLQQKLQSYLESPKWEENGKNNHSAGPNDVHQHHKAVKHRHGLTGNSEILYSSLKNNLRTGDIFLVSGEFPYSWVGKLLQLNKWLHVAMVVLPSDIDPENKMELGKEPLFWESNVSGLGIKSLWPIGKNNKDQGGPMLIPLERRLLKNLEGGQIAEYSYRPLLGGFQANKEMLVHCFDTYSKFRFSKSNWQLLFSTILGRKLNTSFTLLPFGKKMFCSELLAETYRCMSVISDKWVSNAYIPKDFCDEGELDYLGDLHLGDQVVVTME